MKVIFLDIDGVLNCARTITLRKQNEIEGKPLGEFYDLQRLAWDEIVQNENEPLYEYYKNKNFSIVFDIGEDKVKVLSEIIKQTDAKIVLSSSWRWDWKNGPDKLQTVHHRALKALFDKYNIEVVGITPEVAGSNGELSMSSWRENEIKKYLSEHGDITSFCVIDDDIEDLLSLKDYLVTTAFGTQIWDNGGLQEKHIEQVVNILNRKNENEIYNEK